MVWSLAGRLGVTRRLAFVSAGDGERVERVRPAGERRGLAAVGAAGPHEPRRPDAGWATRAEMQIE